MKKMLILASLILLSACATTGQVQSPAQIAAQVCVPTQSVLAVLQADTQIAASGQAVIAKTAPQVAAICANAANINAVDLKTLTNFAFTVILPIAEATNPQIAPELVAAQAIVGIVEANIPPPIAPVAK